MKEKVPASTAQVSQSKLFKELRFVYQWIEDLIEVHDEWQNTFYAHIDHLQILPQGKGYFVIVIYHRVYLIQGE